MVKKLAILMAWLLAFASLPTSATELYGTLKKIKDSGQVVVGHREASVPLSYIGPHGKPIGYSIDLCNRIIDQIKQTLQMPKLKVRFVLIVPQTHIRLVANGTVDIECGATTNTLTRGKRIDYLATTFITGTKLATKKGSNINHIEDLNGKTVGLLFGSTNEAAVRSTAKKLGLQIKFHMVKDHPQGWMALEMGSVDAYASDDVQLYGLISRSKTPNNYVVVGQFLSFDPLSMMVRRDDSAMRLLANGVLADLMRSGEMMTIYDKWFNPGPTNIKMPISGRLKSAFETQALPK